MNAYTTLFHEHVHRSIERLGGVKRIMTLVEELDELDPQLRQTGKGLYIETEINEEIITYSLEAAMYGGAIEELAEALSPKAQWQLRAILQLTGYEKGRDYKREAERFDPAPTDKQFRNRQTRTHRRIAERDRRRGRMDSPTNEGGNRFSEVAGESAQSESVGGTNREEPRGIGRSGEDRVLYRDGDVAELTSEVSGSEPLRAVARERYDRMMASGRYQFAEAVQDSMMGLRLLYKSILGEGQRMEDVASYENAYTAENAMSSRNAAEQHEYGMRYMKPLLSAVYALTGSGADRYTELTDYMLAKHGLERNAVMAERAAKRTADEAVKDAKEEDREKKWQKVYNESYAENRERDYSGLTGLTGEEEVAAAEAKARVMVAEYERAHDPKAVVELWKSVNSATLATLEKTHRGGLLSGAQYDEIRSMYKYYIPLRGWEEKTSGELLTKTSRQFSSHYAY